MDTTVLLQEDLDKRFQDLSKIKLYYVNANEALRNMKMKLIVWQCNFELKEKFLNSTCWLN